MIRKVRKIHC